MGEIHKIGTDGLWGIASGECSTLMGEKSSEVVDGRGTEDEKKINPREASMRKSDVKKYEKYQGGMGVVEYKQYRFGGWFWNTDYAVQDMYKTDPNIPLETVEIPPDGKRGTFDDFGRVVKVSYKGNVKGTTEAILQIGREGSNFLAISIADERMAEAAIKYLKSGKLADFSYSKKVIAGIHDTNLRLFRLSVKHD